MDVKFTDNSKEVLAALESACLRALEECGLTAETYAQKLAPVDTGLLRNSITHAISGEAPAIDSYKANRKDKSGTIKSGKYSGTAPKENGGEKAVYIGTNVEYATSIEMGTGKHTRGGRPDPWVYQDNEGRVHKTGGNTAQPFLKPAVADHKDKYRKIIEKNLKGE